MISVSPHHYRKQATTLGIAQEVVRRAIEQAETVERQGLPAVLTIRHLAHLTGADYKYLRSIVTRAHDGYAPFTISKRSGGKRLIAAPEPQLLAVQRWIARHVLLSARFIPRARPTHAEHHRWLARTGTSARDGSSNSTSMTFSKASRSAAFISRSASADTSHWSHSNSPVCARASTHHLTRQRCRSGNRLGVARRA